MLLCRCGADMTGKSTFKHCISEKAARQTRKKSILVGVRSTLVDSVRSAGGVKALIHCKQPLGALKGSELHAVKRPLRYASGVNPAKESTIRGSTSLSRTPSQSQQHSNGLSKTD